ncbi:MAG: hypothetical protein E7564_01495 [Ruminococcaceae bacterium]|nr:hypothetical protein [Oscillospiraceae bacterium]
MNINLNKKTLSAVAAYGIVLFLFGFAYFIIPFPKSVASYISFVFTVIAIIASALISAYAFSGKEDLRSKVYGFPVFRVGIVYALAQLIFTVLVSLISIFLYIPEWITIFVGVVLLALAALGVIATDNARDVIEAIEAETSVQTKEMKLFRADVSTLAYNVEDAEVKKELEKLSEMFKYSDPVSSEATEPYERELNLRLEDLRASLTIETKEELLASIKAIKNLLAERNRICKLNK